MLADNPLLADTALPHWDTITPEHVTPALDRLLADAERGLAAATADAAGDDAAARWDRLERVLAVPVERLERVWGWVCHLQTVVDTPALRAAHAANLPRVSAFLTRLGADKALYARMRELVEAPGFDALAPVRRKAAHDALRDFVLGGAALEAAAHARHAAIQERLAALSQRFGENLLDATDGWSLTVDVDRLAGVPSDVVAAALRAARQAGPAGTADPSDPSGPAVAIRAADPRACRLTLHAPCRLPLLAHADDRALRETVLRAHVTRASEFGPSAFDNGPLMDEMLALRHEAAALLGHASHAELALVPRMARSPAEVFDFLRDLAERARPRTLAEADELRAFARERLGLDALQAWDLAYAAERLKRERHGIDDEVLRPYFPLPHVLSGLFGLVRELFDAEIEPTDAPAWHPDVIALRIGRAGVPVGTLWLDPCARPGKQAGAWMDGLRGRWRRPDGTLQSPLAALVCNFRPGADGRPPLLTHDDVLTLFHEFGHALHHLLTQVDEHALAGIAGVEWDAVELPSQFLENFAWEWPVLQRISAHADTGQPLPRETCERLRDLRRFHAGLRLMRMVECALLDMRLHTEADAPGRVPSIAREVHAAVGVLPRCADDRWPNGFDHVFDGGYAAGYYGYHWAEVLSADAYAAFEAVGADDAGALRAAGARFAAAVLATGGSRPALDSFVAFRGRPPTLDAFLRHQGLDRPPPDVARATPTPGSPAPAQATG